MGDFKLSNKEEKELISAIQHAEKLTSGEIRIHISNQKTIDYLKTAEKIFYAIKMDKTQNRNGVLFYIAPKSHVFTIIGDKGINDLVGNDFWQQIKNEVINEFKNDNFVGGLVNGVQKVGAVLQEHFPAQNDNKNELPDEINWD